jgi:hypothetical protein
MRTQTPDAEKTKIAKVAASRAEALRAHAAALNGEVLAPLRKALLIRAAELDLTADVLLEPAPPRPRLQAIA